MIFLSFLFFKIIDILNDISRATVPLLAVSLKFGFFISIRNIIIIYFHFNFKKLFDYT